MTKLEKVKKFLDFYFSPWGAAKGERWEWLTNDKPFSDDMAHITVMEILAGVEALNWEALGND